MSTTTPPSVEIPLSADPSTVALVLKRGPINDLLACATSMICDIPTAKSIFSLDGHQKRITGLSWASPHLLLSSGRDQSVRAWDIRMKQQAGAFSFPQDLEPEQRGKMKYFCVANNPTLVAAGMESLIYLWDSRIPDRFYACWEAASKGTDVNQLLWHPQNQNMLLVGSEDGVISIYDSSKTDSDDAFTGALQMERSVEDIGLFGPSSEYLWSTSLTRDLALWNLYNEKENSIVQFDETIISSLGKVSGEPIFALLSCCYSNLEQCLLLFTTTLTGSIIIFEIKENSIEFKTKLLNGHRDVGRVSVWIDDLGLYATGAEDNSVRLWKSRGR